MAEPPSDEARERAWWDAWRRADYSWLGLTDKLIGEKNGEPIHGGFRGERTLQDYWRRDPATGAIRDDQALRDAGELIDDLDGNPWHIVHVPMHWHPDAPAKAGWDEVQIARMNAVIAARLGEAKDTKTTFWGDAEAPDGRAQLAGAVCVALTSLFKDSTSHLHLVCDQAWLPSWDAFNRTFGEGTRFRGASFTEDALFARATFAGYACFDNASFAGNVGFVGASFARLVSFDDASFAGNVSFLGASFAGYASFKRASFAGYARFNDASFAGNVGFVGASFARGARFDRASCAGDASFERASFAGYASFERASFAGDARFDRASFSRHLLFTRAVFRKSASFVRIAWPSEARRWHAAFEQAVFEDWAVFEGAGFQALAAFADAVLKLGLKFDEVPEGEAKKRFEAERAGALAAARADFKEAEAKNKGSGDLRAAKLSRLKELERGCRVLKQAMEKASHKTREQLFYRFELMARRVQSDTPWWERRFSDLYGLSSDFGASIARPLGVLILVWLPLFGAAYWIIAALFDMDLSHGLTAGVVAGLRGRLGVDQLLHALVFSVTRAFPLGAIGNDATSDPWLSAFLAHGPLATIMIRLMGILETVGAAGFAFLSGLAVKRRFQIN